MYDNWIDIKKRLPQCNVIVKVKLTNGVEALDFVNKPIDKEMQFQHYHVSKWRMATSEELNEFIHKANRDSILRMHGC